jgi:hypothetical protein
VKKVKEKDLAQKAQTPFLSPTATNGAKVSHIAKVVSGVVSGVLATGEEIERTSPLCGIVKNKKTQRIQSERPFFIDKCKDIIVKRRKLNVLINRKGNKLTN